MTGFDPHEFFLERRTVLLRGPLDERLAGTVAAQLMALDACGDGHVDLHVDSPGGPLHAAFTVIDVMDLLGVPVHTLCVGRAEGSAAGVVASGTHRLLAPNARIHLCEPAVAFEGRAHVVSGLAETHAAVLQDFVRRLARATGRPGEHIEAELSVGRWLSAEEAVRCGLADGIWGADRSGGGDHKPMGFRPLP